MKLDQYVFMKTEHINILTRTIYITINTNNIGFRHRWMVVVDQLCLYPTRSPNTGPIQGPAVHVSTTAETRKLLSGRRLFSINVTNSQARDAKTATSRFYMGVSPTWLGQPKPYTCKHAKYVKTRKRTEVPGNKSR